MKLLKKWILPGAFALLALIAVILVAVASVQGAHGTTTIVIKGITFGAYESVIADSGISMTTKLDFGPAIMPLLGWILILLGLLCGVCLAFFGEKLFKNTKLVKILLLVAAGLVLVGGVFQFFALSSFVHAGVRAHGGTYEDAMESLKQMNASVPLCIVGGILSILGAASLAVREFLPEK